MKAGPLATGVGLLALLFLLLPLGIVALMSFSSASSLQFPPPGLSLRWYYSFFGNPRWIDALGTSVWLAALSSTISVVLGGLAAYGLARGTFPGRGLVDSNLMAPLILPSIVLAVALYLIFARVGLLGTAAGLTLAHVVLASPYVVFVTGVGIRALDGRLEQVAATLGASRIQILLRVVVPNVLPSLATSWILAFIASFDEVIVTLFVAGTYQTVPKRMFNELILEVNPTITAIATVMAAVSVAAIGLAALAGGRRFLASDAAR